MDGITLQKRNGFKSVIWWLDAFSLIAVMQYAAYRFLQSTMFTFVYSETFKLWAFVLPAAVGGIRVLYLTGKKLKAEETRRKRIRLIICVLCLGCLALPFVYVGWKHDYKFLIFLPFLAMCLVGMEPEKVLKCFVYVVGSLLASTVICCLTGTVRNLTYYIRSGYIISSYGIINTTDFASYFTYLFLFFWCSQKHKNWLSSVLFAVLIGVTSYGVSWLTESRTIILCGGLTVIMILWDCFGDHVLSKTHRGQEVKKAVNNLTVAAMPVICIVFSALLLLYATQNPLGVKIDDILTERISTPLGQIREYGLHLFGSDISTMHGNGATLIRNWSSGYGYLDSAYSMLAIRYGIVILLIVICLWAWTTFASLRAGKTRIALSMVIIAFHAFSEARFLDVNYNILLIMPFCAYPRLSPAVSKLTLAEPGSSEKTPCFSMLSAAVMAVVLYLFLPRILSFLRTVYFLKGWTEGIFAAGALIVSMMAVVLVLSFWKLINLLWKRRTVKNWILLGFVCFLGAFTLFTGNRMIQNEMIVERDQLDAEETIIHAIQAAATQPVYVVDKSEIYQRRFGGFTEHIFSTEELCRPPYGTMITDASTDAMEIWSKGAIFYRISPVTAVYTYDQGIKDALKEAGYRWSRYYTGERIANLADLAIRNGLSMNNDKLVLHGTNHSISRNIERDQFAGSYEVRYLMEVLDLNMLEDQEVCTLLVKGEEGDTTILERKVYLRDFDENGMLDITVSYEIPDTPKVSYLIEGVDGIKIYLSQISWKRIM